LLVVHNDDDYDDDDDIWPEVLGTRSIQYGPFRTTQESCAKN
jgi:hypothetical protein